MSSDLMLKTAEELSELIRTRTVSSCELLDEAVARFEAFNPTVNAITEHKIEEAQKLQGTRTKPPHAVSQSGFYTDYR